MASQDQGVCAGKLQRGLADGRNWEMVLAKHCCWQYIKIRGCLMFARCEQTSHVQSRSDDASEQLLARVLHSRGGLRRSWRHVGLVNCNAMVEAIDVACAGVLLVAHERRALLTAAQRPTAASQPYADWSLR